MALELPSVNRSLLVVLGSALLVGLAFQGTRGLYETSEGRYAEVGREMLVQGDLLRPTLQGTPHWTKPPLTYWAVAAGIRAFGANAWGARLMAAVAFFLATLGVVGAGLALWGRRAGVWAGACFCSMPLTVIAANTLTTDIFLTAWVALAVWAFAFQHVSDSARAQRAAQIGFWICTGLAFLTKGPPALIFLPALIVWHFRRSPRPRLFGVAGIAAFMVVGLGWYLLMMHLTPGLARIWILGEFADRVFSSKSHNDEWYKTFSVYGPVLTVGLGAWFVFAVLAVRGHGAYRLKRLWQFLTVRTPEGWLLLWMLTSMVLLSIASSKLQLYVLPLAIPFALLVGRYLGDRLNLERAARSVFAGSVLALILLKGVLAYVPHQRDMSRLAEACRRAAGVEHVLALTLEPGLNGLQFYLNGCVERYGSVEHPTVSRPGGGLRAMVNRIQKATDPQALVFVGKTGASGGIRSECRSTNIQVKLHTCHGWDLLTFSRSE